MKRYLFPLIIFFSQSTPVLSETWIYVTGYYEDGGKRYERFIDVSSIVKNGNWRYANMKFTSPRGENTAGIRVNCKNLIFGYDVIEVTRSKKNYWVKDDGGKSAFSKVAEGSLNFLCKKWQ